MSSYSSHHIIFNTYRGLGNRGRGDHCKINVDITNYGYVFCCRELVKLSWTRLASDYKSTSWPGLLRKLNGEDQKLSKPQTRFSR